MFGSDSLEVLFVVWSFFIQVVLIVHFSMRKWAFDRYTWKYGWIVYALSIPSALVSLIILLGGKSWSFWLGGFLFLVWAIYGYRIDYIQQRRWRNPINWRIAGPYVTLYLATIMFYWWPLGLVSRTLWFVFAGLFVISTWLNITSHHPSKDLDAPVVEEVPKGSVDMP